LEEAGRSDGDPGALKVSETFWPVGVFAEYGQYGRGFSKHMKTLSRSFVALGLLSASIALANAVEAGYVDFGKLNPTGDQQFVEVNVKSNLIAMVANLTKKSEPEVAEVINGLKQIRVNVLGLNKENREDISKRVTEIREKLDKDGWERVVTAIEKNQDVGVFLKMKDAKVVEGLCVTVVEKGQAVLVNIVGNIQPEKLAMVGERFNIEPLMHIPARPKDKLKDKDDTKS
jgi:Skp family chaperone for outer membrane proteins